MVEEITLTSLAYGKMMDFATLHAPREVIGVCAGIKENIDVTISEVYPMNVGSNSYVELTDENYEEIPVFLASLRAKNPQLQLIGWFHSHPFGGAHSIYMSRTDIAYHKNAQQFFGEWLSLILDPYEQHNASLSYGVKAFTLQLKGFWRFKTMRPVQIPVTILRSEYE